jgi:release factor glutamine methyltransferase
MIGSRAIFNDFVNNIKLPETRDERASIASRVFEKFFNLSRTEIMADVSFQPSPEQHVALQSVLSRINQHEPVQYILGEADFFGRRFNVNDGVLIPRPETEELVRLVLEEITGRGPCHVLDIGTGSGCIPITIKLEASNTDVIATDISDVALSVARENAARMNADVTFTKHDILHEDLMFQNVDVITSNPPYIAYDEKKLMSKNVTNYEPALALFVPDDDPLIFYKRIAAQANHILRAGGMLAVEINERFGRDVMALFQASGFTRVRILKDLSNKDRIVKGYTAITS